MNTAVEIIGIACMVVIIMHNSHLYAKFVSKVNGAKPFSCEMCMSFWTFELYSIVNYEFSAISVLSGFICAVLGYLISLKFITWEE